jgi:hypothetical protein
MKYFRQLLAVVVITFIATHTAFAGVPTTIGGGAPEIDPALGMGALAFLGGAILVIRGRVKL